MEDNKTNSKQSDQDEDDVGDKLGMMVDGGELVDRVEVVVEQVVDEDDDAGDECWVDCGELLHQSFPKLVLSPPDQMQLCTLQSAPIHSTFVLL